MYIIKKLSNEIQQYFDTLFEKTVIKIITKITTDFRQHFHTIFGKTRFQKKGHQFKNSKSLNDSSISVPILTVKNRF